MNRFNNKVVIITGGSNGLGADIATTIAANGAFVYILDIDQKNGKEVSSLICNSGGMAEFIYADILDYELLKLLVYRINSKHSKIDILINNAGGALPDDDKIYNLSSNTWNHSMNINLNGHFYCSKAVLPYMQKNCSGVITNIGSVNGSFSYGNPSYSAAKSALISLTKSIAVEYGKYGIRCNIVIPGTMKTLAWSERVKFKPDLFEKLSKWYPIGRVAELQEITAAICFLSSDEASFITGTSLIVDGGLTAAGDSLLREEIAIKNEEVT